MLMKKEKLTCNQAKKVSIVDFLAKNGYQPAKVQGNDYWYLSPFRNESDPSFKVNSKMNVWYDFGLGKGGDLIDLGEMLFNCSTSEFLEKLNKNSFSFDPHSSHKNNVENNSDSGIHVTEIKKVTNINLLNYIKSRGIKPQIALNYLNEVHYNVKGRNYYALGFKNDSGGYELRNEYYPSTVSPKDITTIKKNNHSLAVFEGFFDFLSIFQTKIIPPGIADFLVLNSLAFIPRAQKHFWSYERIYLFLDNDNAGKKAAQQIQKLELKDVVDNSHHYQKHNDLNEFLRSEIRQQKQEQQRNQSRDRRKGMSM